MHRPRNWRARPRPRWSSGSRRTRTHILNDHATGRRRILPPQRVAVPAGRGGREGRQAADPGGAADRPACDRSEPARPGRSAADRPDRVELEKITLDAMVRPLTVTAETVEAVHGRQAGELLLARAARPPRSRTTRSTASASSSISSPSSISPRSSPASDATDAIRKAAADLKLATDYRRAAAPDRAGPRSRTRNSPP